MQAVLWAPAALGLFGSACDPAGKTEAQPQVAEAAKPAVAAAAPAPAGEAAASAPAAPSYPERWGMDPYDPESEEEHGCVVGDWCGPLAAAKPFANVGAGEEMGCPARVHHVPDAKVKKTDKVYVGFSFDPMMQGRLRPMATREGREAAKSDDLCCYHWYNYCSGRPLLAEDDEDSAQVAPVTAEQAWSRGEVAPMGAIDPALREHVAALWLRDARLEHASIASFARTTLELLAVGAAPWLIAASQRAGLDEVEHAEACFALASRYAGEPLGPGPLPALPPRALDLAGLAEATFIEGCVGETIAALVATRAAQQCTDPTITPVLAKIAEDEARHAELAWATVTDALLRGGTAVAAAVRAAAERIRARTLAPAPTGPSWAAPLLAAHGRLDEASAAQARVDAWREIIEPTLEELLAAAPKALRAV